VPAPSPERPRFTMHERTSRGRSFVHARESNVLKSAASVFGSGVPGKRRCATVWTIPTVFPAGIGSE